MSLHWCPIHFDLRAPSLSHLPNNFSLCKVYKYHQYWWFYRKNVSVLMKCETLIRTTGILYLHIIWQVCWPTGTKTFFLSEKPCLLIPVTHTLNLQSQWAQTIKKALFSSILPAANNEWHWAVSGSWLAYFLCKLIIWRPLAAKLCAQPRLVSTTIVGRFSFAEKKEPTVNGGRCTQTHKVLQIWLCTSCAGVCERKKMFLYLCFFILF